MRGVQGGPADIGEGARLRSQAPEAVYRAPVNDLVVEGGALFWDAGGEARGEPRCVEPKEGLEHRERVLEGSRSEDYALAG